RVPENSVRNRSRREIVIRESRLIRRRQELEESERRRRDPIGANDIQLAVAADLIAKVLGIAGTDVRSRVEVGVQPSGERVVDRDQIPGGIPPIGEVTVSFLRSGEGQWIDADTASLAEELDVREEISARAIGIVNLRNLGWTA